MVKAIRIADWIFGTGGVLITIDQFFLQGSIEEAVNNVGFPEEAKAAIGWITFAYLLIRLIVYTVRSVIALKTEWAEMKKKEKEILEK